MMSSKNVLVMMSGGTTNVINATLVGVVRAARDLANVGRVFAGVPGILGLLHGSFADLTDLSEDDLSRLYLTPASGFIGTTRVKILEKEELRRIGEILAEKDIGYVLNIGGNGTIEQSRTLARSLRGQVRVAALPKTVDNDLGDPDFSHVYFTPGFPSCVNYWRHKVHVLNQENLGAHTHDRVLVAQTFGRKTGFIAGAARFGDPNRELPLLLLLPEDQQPIEKVLAAVEDVVRKRGRAIVVLSEGYDVGGLSERYDERGQIMYGSSRTTAAQVLVNKCMDAGIQSRAFIPGVDQRSDILYAMENDLLYAHSLGYQGLASLSAGHSEFLQSITRNLGSRTPLISRVSFSEIQNFSRALPGEWLRGGQFDVSDDYQTYLSDVVVGQPLYARELFPSPGFVHMKESTPHKSTS